jgi:hypothetical protein
MIDDTPTLIFAKSCYHLETEEAERVSVDQVDTSERARQHSAYAYMQAYAYV